MTCHEIEVAITRTFNAIKSKANNGNITDEMVVKTNFNDLKELAKSQCNVDYSIEWTNTGYSLVKK